MKKTIHSSILLLVVIALINSACSHTPKNKNNALTKKGVERKPTWYPLPGEDTLSLVGDSVDPTIENNELQIRNACIGIFNPATNNVDVIKYLYENVDTNTLNNLYNRALNLLNSVHAKLTGLEIMYGMDSTHKFVLLFRPLALMRAGYIQNGLIGVYTITNASVSVNNKFCTYDTGAKRLIFIDTSLVRIDTDIYRKYIRIKDTIKASVYNPFNPAIDSTGSIRSVIFPFQEIKALIRDNRTGSKGGYVGVMNVAIQYPVCNRQTGKKDSLIKEDILLAPSNMPEDSLKQYEKFTFFLQSGQFTQKYADLNHLCPPDCDSGTFKFYLLKTQ